MLSSETLLLNVHIILWGPFSGCSSSYVVCVYNHYCRMNQNCCLTMDMTSHLSCLSDDFYFCRVSFSLVMSLIMMGLGPGHLVRALLHFALTIPLVVSVVLALAFLFRLESSQLVTFFCW